MISSPILDQFDSFIQDLSLGPAIWTTRELWWWHTIIYININEGVDRGGRRSKQAAFKELILLHKLLLRLG